MQVANISVHPIPDTIANLSNLTNTSIGSTTFYQVIYKNAQSASIKDHTHLKSLKIQNFLKINSLQYFSTEEKYSKVLISFNSNYFLAAT